MAHVNIECESRIFQALPGRSAALCDPPAARAVHFSRPPRRRVQPLSSATLLRNAMERHELSLHYQPQYEIGGGRHCGVEALARWFRPNGDSIAPSIFIRQAEQSGLIRALGAWVLHEACSTVAGWRYDGQQLPILCVNVSPRQISPEFSSVLASTLASTGFPAARLELEITEGILIEKPVLALECLEQWKRLGVRIALDDFGIGYSSLSYLSRMPVDRIKIDKSLIDRMNADERTAAIVRAVISLGSDLGVDVLAEGVESETQFTMLSDMGCQQAQGFLLALPVRAEEARAALASRWGRRPVHASLPTNHFNAASSYAF